MKTQKSIVFLLVLAVFCFFPACEQPDKPAVTAPPPPKPGETADNPIGRIADADTNLGTMTSSASGWQLLLNSINATGKYINLDLSACTMTGTSFNPAPDVETGKKYIVSIILPAAATSIEVGDDDDPTFKNFTNLKSISGANVTTIGAYSFYRDLYGDYSYSYLQSADFPKATTIGQSAFGGTSLETANFPQVTTIGDSAFSSCWRLKNAGFPLVQSIGIYAFSFCSDLENISFPASATVGLSEGSYSNPFTFCDKLIFTLSGTGSLSVIENGKALVRNSTILLAYPSASGSITMNTITALDGRAFISCRQLTGVNLPQVTSIGNSAFEYCSNIQSVNFPQATSIDISAFSNCSRLQSANFPLVKTIGRSAFSGCFNLVSLSIPQVTKIGSYSFHGSEPLSITMGSAAPTLDPQIFVTTAKTVTVKVPSGASGYTPFTGTAVTVSGTNTTANWANGLRGGGWTGTTWPQYSGANNIDQNITVIIQQQ